MALGVAHEHFAEEGFSLENIQFQRPLMAAPEKTLQVSVVPYQGQPSYHFQIVTLEEDLDGDPEWAVYVEGDILVGESPPSMEPTLSSAQATCDESVSVEDHYGELAAVNIVWGPLWKWTQEAFAGEGLPEGGLVKLAPPGGMVAGDAPLHPVVIDNGFAASGIAVKGSGEDDTPQLPFAVDRIAWYRQASGPLWCYNRPLEVTEENSRFDLQFWDESGRPVAEISGFRIKRAPSSVLLGSAGADPLDRLRFRVDWRSMEVDSGIGDDPLYGWSFTGASGRERLHSQSENANLSPEWLEEIPEDAPAESGTLVCFWDTEGDPASIAHAMGASALEQLQRLTSWGPGWRVLWVSVGAPGESAPSPAAADAARDAGPFQID